MSHKSNKTVVYYEIIYSYKHNMEYLLHLLV